MAPYHVRMYERRLDSNTAPCVTLKVPKGPSAPQDPLKAVATPRVGTLRFHSCLLRPMIWGADPSHQALVLLPTLV